MPIKYGLSPFINSYNNKLNLDKYYLFKNNFYHQLLFIRFENEPHIIFLC